MLVSSDYYPALQKDNCKLIDWPIATISPVGIRTSDGVEHHLDAIVFATGYDVHLTGPPYPVTGIGGRSLAEEWAGGAQAYKSINAHGYPEPVLHDRPQLRARPQLAAGLRRGTDRLRRFGDLGNPAKQPALPRRPRGRAARYNERIQKRLTKTTWMSGCSSWYLTTDGFNASMYPGFATQYLRQMRDFRFGDYTAHARSDTTTAVARDSTVRAVTSSA